MFLRTRPIERYRYTEGVCGLTIAVPVVWSAKTYTMQAEKTLSLDATAYKGRSHSRAGDSVQGRNWLQRYKLPGCFSTPHTWAECFCDIVFRRGFAFFCQILCAQGKYCSAGPALVGSSNAPGRYNGGDLLEVYVSILSATYLGTAVSSQRQMKGCHWFASTWTERDYVVANLALTSSTSLHVLPGASKELLSVPSAPGSVYQAFVLGAV